MNLINELPTSFRALDLGCGKLRYSLVLARRVKQVIAVDSPNQVDRIQKIGHEANVTLRQYVDRRCKNVEVYSTDQRTWKRYRYDFVLLANVLSAIPTKRSRIQLLMQARDVMKRRGGHLLIVTNFSNSRFRDWELNDRAIRYGDGWLLEGSRGNSFFGMIPLNRLKAYVREVGLTVLSSGTHRSEVAYVEAQHPSRAES